MRSVGHAQEVRGMAYAAVFMAPQTHSASSPHTASVWLAIRALREG